MIDIKTASFLCLLFLIGGIAVGQYWAIIPPRKFENNRLKLLKEYNGKIKGV